MVKESAAEVIARENDIYVKLNYPVKISKGSTDIEISEYTATIPVRLDYIYEVSRQVVAKTMADPEWVDMAFLSGFDAKVDIIPNDNSSFIYSITDQRSRAGDASFVFLFANKFIVNQPPVMTVPDILKFQEGKPSLYKVNATDPEKDVLVFSDDSSLFDISEKGVILFTPEVPGMYDVTLTVEDTHRNKVSRLVKFRIE
jgi:hypothetical protein